jgi:hypothetical protein
MTVYSLLPRWLSLIICLILFSTGVAHSRDFKLRKKTANFTLEMKIDRNPPVVDKNRVTLEIRDNDGKNITDAKVIVNYYMPPMPGMPPMNYNTAAQLQGNEYTAIMDLIMAGPWNIIVRISRAGKTSSVVFNIDVR